MEDFFYLLLIHKVPQTKAPLGKQSYFCKILEFRQFLEQFDILSNQSLENPFPLLVEARHG